MLTDAPPRASFRHEALLYSRPREFVECSTSFIRDALESSEPVLVVVNAEKIDWLQSALGRDADDVFFADMAKVGLNPSRIIPAWREFVGTHGVSGRGLRGIGEPIWPGRSDAELDECQRHESLLNLAFTDTPPWWLLCPYDTEALAPEVIDEAYRNHPYIWHGEDRRDSDGYAGAFDQALDGPFTEPGEEVATITFGGGPLSEVRRFVRDHSAVQALNASRTADLLIAVNEVASNSIRHGGGDGVLRVWQGEESVICEIRDNGHISHPLVGRERPPADADGGRGLWMANQLCDLVQLRSNAGGTAVRLHMRR